MKLSQRTKNLELSATIALADKIREQIKLGNDIISLSGGQPDFPTSDNIKNASIKALNENFVFYSHSRGILDLRRSISERYSRRYGVHLDPNKNVLITPGCKQGILYFVLALIEDGDEVIIPTPSWMTYTEIVKIAGGVPVQVDISSKDSFQLSVDLIKKNITHRTKAIILNSPNNPTGQIIDKMVLEEIYKLCLDRDIFLLCDEIYEKLIFNNNNFASICDISKDFKNCALINGFSKSYSMTGWRLGYVVARAELIDAMVKFQQNSATCPTTFTQFGAIEALDNGDDIALKFLQYYQENLKYIIAEFKNFNKFKIIIPQGGLYVFIDVSMINESSYDFCLDLLDKCKIAAVPGGVFGKTGEGYIRINLAVARKKIEVFVDKIKTYYEDVRLDMVDKNIKQANC